MKIAILSDIHGNSCALKAVLNEIKNEGLTTLLIAGDFVGYYYDVASVIRLLENFEVIACKGNHENLLADWVNGSKENRDRIAVKYGSSFDIILRELTNSQLDWLFNLQHPVRHRVCERRILLSHGSPWDINCYLYKDTIKNHMELFKKFIPDYNLIVLGHSHYQFIEKIDDLSIVNPGSVGQPRSGNSAGINNNEARAEWATYCCLTEQIELKTTFYSPNAILKKIEKYDNNLPYLKNVLLRR